MTFSFLGPDPVEVQVEAVIRRLVAGEVPGCIEVAQVDVKEEPGRRGSRGEVRPGGRENEEAARYLAGELSCLANTPGGGAIVLGIADDGRRIGTELDGEWLRHRIWELTERALTVDVRNGLLDGTRLLVLTTHEAIEPIRYQGRVRWRLDDHCVEVDPTTWHSRRLDRVGVDWSAQPAGHTFDDVSPVAVEIGRRYLRAAGDDAAMDLASASDADLLRRLNVVHGDDRLTNGGSLLFVGTPWVGLDYIRREVPGGDSTVRLRSSASLLEQLWDVDQASQSVNRVVHVSEGLARGQMRALPVRAFREAIVNGMVHRDWLSIQQTTVEHVGDAVTITSPGGFIGGVDPSNIITHPAVARYRSLAEAVASLRLAEREGIGVDRMVRDMLANGRPEPEISEVNGPYVRVALLGGEPDRALLSLLADVDPATVRADVDALLLIEHLCRNGWVDATRAAPVLQRPQRESQVSIERLASAESAGTPLIVQVAGLPTSALPAYRLGDRARDRLVDRLRYHASAAGREKMLMTWARAHRRVSSTETADLLGLSVVRAGQILTALEEQGRLRAGRPNKAGRGFFYVPVE